ncbi:MAG: hypothetical protein CVV33_03445 [Methanomicrobiales archaeon HGW-Methanomicrobiales-4]|nr:MAG: hypothetical protein CVV33_03445 [Methanomicrobiales archaeon HGW-Methanomicrobiales-4]
MKLLAIVLAIGFCLMVGSPLAAGLQPDERRAACCTSEEQSTSGRMSCHGPGGMQTCTCQTRPSSSPPNHSCGSACMQPVALPGQQNSILLRIKYYAVRGYRRISGRNVLDHVMRQKIYDQIITHPGVDLKTLISLSEINAHTLRYHLAKMESGSKIRVTTTGGVCHYFENHGKYSDDEQVLISRLFASGSSRILHLVSIYPGLTRGELAGHLGVAGPTVSRSISHLIDDKLIRPERDGRCTRYYPGWDTNFSCFCQFLPQ